MRHVTYHGYEFSIDTSDWAQNSSSAEKASSKLCDFLSGRTQEQIKALHAALKAYAEGEDCDDNIVQEAFDAGNQAALAVMQEENWAVIPETGHNCDLAAE